MKLHTFAQGPNPRRVHIFLAEKGLDVPCERVDIMKRENKQPAHLERDAMGRVPVLELDDGTHIAESVAICRYLEALHPEPALFGRDAAEIGRVEMWIRRMELDLMFQIGLIWVHGSPLTAALMPKQIPEVAEMGRRAVDRELAMMDRALAEAPFLAGSDYSMADIVALCSLDFGIQLNGVEPDAALGNLLAWHERVSSRPSAKS